MSHTHVSLNYHFVWGTWRRRPLLASALVTPVYNCILARCRELGATPLALGGVEDHVHLLVGSPASLAPSKIIGPVKGVSSHLAHHDLGREAFGWQRGYAVHSVSNRGVDHLRAYILAQRAHHDRGDLIPAYEWCPDDT